MSHTYSDSDFKNACRVIPCIQATCLWSVFVFNVPVYYNLHIVHTGPLTSLVYNHCFYHCPITFYVTLPYMCKYTPSFITPYI